MIATLSLSSSTGGFPAHVAREDASRGLDSESFTRRSPTSRSARARSDDARDDDEDDRDDPRARARARARREDARSTVARGRLSMTGG